MIRHANTADRHNGGVIMAMGDDHTGESSTTLQSDWAMVDAYMPIVSPAGVQEILDISGPCLGFTALCGVP
jgi:indolepyruvate ferredoxin oxidoreductase